MANLGIKQSGSKPPPAPAAAPASVDAIASLVREAVPLIYPSASCPPVANPYLFVWTFGHPNFDGMVANVLSADRAGDRRTPGVLYVKWCYGPQNPDLKSKQEFVDYYCDLARANHAAIGLDEWQEPRDNTKYRSIASYDPYGINGAIKGLMEAKKIRPAMYTIVYWRGEPSVRTLLERQPPDLLVLEAYTHQHKSVPRDAEMSMQTILQRVEYARQLGAIERTIVMLGHIEKPEDFHPDHRLTVKDIEQQVATLRRVAPEMPGVGFFRAADPELARAADRIIARHFVEPAPLVRIESPSAGQQVPADRVTVTASAEPKPGRSIREYRWFLNNRLVGRSREGTFDVSMKSSPPGDHVLTVHAIDDRWNRAAAQITVTVQSQ